MAETATRSAQERPAGAEQGQHPDPGVGLLEQREPDVGQRAVTPAATGPRAPNEQGRGHGDRGRDQQGPPAPVHEAFGPLVGQQQEPGDEQGQRVPGVLGAVVGGRQLVGGQQHQRHRPQQPAGADPPAAPAHQQRQGDEREDEQEADEPQVGGREAARVTAEVALHRPVVAEEGGDRHLLAAEAAGQEPLGWDHHQEAEQQRDQQTPGPLAHVPRGPALPQGQPGGRPGEHEQQRHVPGVEERHHGPGEPAARLRVLHVEGIEHVEHPRAVERDQQQHGQHPQRVQVVPSVA